MPFSRSALIALFHALSFTSIVEMGEIEGFSIQGVRIRIVDELPV